MGGGVARMFRLAADPSAPLAQLNGVCRDGGAPRRTARFPDRLSLNATQYSKPFVPRAGIVQNPETLHHLQGHGTKRVRRRADEVESSPAVDRRVFLWFSVYTYPSSCRLRRSRSSRPVMVGMIVGATASRR